MVRTSKRPAASGESLVDALARAAFVTMAVLNRLGGENDLSLTQLRVFGILRDRRLRMAALARYLGLEKSTMTGLVDRAEKRGLMVRAPSEEDGRAIDVYLTTEGQIVAERLEAQFRAAMTPFTKRLNGVEQRRLRDQLERMLDTPDE
jgi:DNA-binding MarR family transcriptional regulator